MENNTLLEEFKKAALEALGEEPMVWTDDDEYAKGERAMWQSCVAAIKALELPKKRRIYLPPCSISKRAGSETRWMGIYEKLK